MIDSGQANKLVSFLTEHHSGREENGTTNTRPVRPILCKDKSLCGRGELKKDNIARSSATKDTQQTSIHAKISDIAFQSLCLYLLASFKKEWYVVTYEWSPIAGRDECAGF
jgi:hypothetical protein